MYTKALRLSRLRLNRSEQRVRRLDFLADHTATELLSTLPDQVLQLFDSVSSLPPLDPTAPTVQPLPDPSKRPWETSKAGYLNWAVGQLVSRSSELAPNSRGSLNVGNTVQQAASIGEAPDLKNALKEFDGHIQEDDRMDADIDADMAT